MRKQNISLMGILLFILVIISIDFNLASAQVPQAGFELKTVDASAAYGLGGSSVLGNHNLMSKELSGASPRLQEV